VALVSAFGTLWLSTEILSFFSSSIADSIRDKWWLFSSIGFLYAVYICKPIDKFSMRLPNRDAIIEIAIGDIFAFTGDLIVGSNTTFDVSLALISDKSIQGQFSNRYYERDDKLDLELQEGLKGIPFVQLTADRQGKMKQYKIGTVCKVMPKGRTAYFVAIAHINEHGNAYGNFEQIKDALVNLWVFIGEKGRKDPIIMPIIGTGFTRIEVPREEVIREIVLSFIAACAEKIFCEKLTIVIAPSDVIKYSIDIQNLADFIRHECEYTRYSPIKNNKRGVGLN
jgi:hypothetical protein